MRAAGCCGLEGPGPRSADPAGPARTGTATTGPVQQAFAAIVRAEVALISALNVQIDALGEVVKDHFGRHPAAEVITSLPGLGPILGARLLGEFGDDPDRYVDAKARKAYAGTAPVTKASGKIKVV